MAVRGRWTARRGGRPVGPALLSAMASAALLAGCAEIDKAAEDLGEATEAVAEDIDSALSDEPDRYAEARSLDAEGRDAEAVAIYRELADAGDAAAAFELGEAYETGEGVARDADRAAHWYNIAVDRGSPRAQVLVGRAMYQGAGVPRDEEGAVALFAAAAQQGHPPGQYWLGRAFANGRGAPWDRLWAGRWYGKAARRGHAGAQFAYGAMLAADRGTPQDLPLAYAMLSAAAEQGNAVADDLRATLEDSMTAETRAAARRAADALAAGPAQSFADPPTVRYVQAALNRLGHEAGPVDGIAGTRTAEGIRAFQRAQGLPVDGRLTPALLERLVAAARES